MHTLHLNIPFRVDERLPLLYRECEQAICYHMYMKNAVSYCDLVLEGGGVKGIGIVGATQVLEQRGFGFQRIAGTSAGAIVGALLAAGYTSDELHELLLATDYELFRDETLLSRFWLPGKALSLLFQKGVYRGKFLHDWLAEKLAAKGVRTFGDLKITEPWCEQAKPEQRYKLVVLTADVTRGKLIRLPWDYHEYGLNPDEQSVADAVQASVAIPFFYTPPRLNRNMCVDGGIVSNFPLDLFDSTPDWPTIGIKLSTKPEANLSSVQPIHNSVDFGRNIITTMLNGQDQIHLDNPAAIERTIFVDTDDIKSTDFAITESRQTFLYKNGQHAARKFLRK